MRNYYFSITVHVIFLLMLVFPFLDKDSKSLEVENVIMVDFRNLDSKKSTEIKNPPVTKKAVSPDHLEEKKLNTKKKPPKSVQKTTDPVQKIKKEEIPPKSRLKKIDTKKEQNKVDKNQETESQLIEKKERAISVAKQKETNKKRSYFKDLINRSQHKPSTGSSQKSVENSKTDAGSSIVESSSISGNLSTRKVLVTPQIKDNSQKQGRVVVKICVNAEGKVISSEFTQMGSTTSDAYLIQLAESGAGKYIFTSSSNPRECGKVFIDFELK